MKNFFNFFFGRHDDNKEKYEFYRILGSKKILFTSKRLPNEKNKILTSRYFFIEINGSRVEMTSKTDIREYLQMLDIQIEFLGSKSIDMHSIYEALIHGCTKHILKFGRLHQADLWSHLNCSMHIIDATNGVFHNLIKDSQSGHSIRILLQSKAEKDLQQYIIA